MKDSGVDVLLNKKLQTEIEIKAASSVERALAPLCAIRGYWRDSSDEYVYF